MGHGEKAPVRCPSTVIYKLVEHGSEFKKLI